jgi:uncharacterized membrane protein YeaQ/YmgE (transglycosylase-associated protein family)
MTTSNIVAWIVIGLIVGVLFALLRRSETQSGLLVDMVLGVFGGFVGGAALNVLGGLVGAEIIGVNLGGALVAVIGAAILLFIWAMLRGEREL